MRLLRSLLARRGLSDPEFDSRVATWSKSYANLPERYLLRKTTRAKYISPPHPTAFRQSIELTKIPQHRMIRPWTQEYWKRESPWRRKHNTMAQPIREQDWMWFKGDRVEILVGKDKGKQGYINFVLQERNLVTVEGLNTTFKVMGKTPDFPGMGMLEEQPLRVTDQIKLVDPVDEKMTEVEWRHTEAGERIRVAVRSDTELPIPSQALETIDYKTPAGYQENKEKDTVAADVEAITYEPTLSTFEMDIMDAQGIKEDRIPLKTYWY